MISAKRWCIGVVLLPHTLGLTGRNADFVEVLYQQIEIFCGHYRYIAQLQLFENEED